MEKSILDMMLELTTLVHEFNEASDEKGVKQSLSIQIHKKTFDVCKWDDSGKAPKIIHSAYGGLVSENSSSNRKEHIQNIIDMVSHEVQSMKSKGE